MSDADEYFDKWTHALHERDEARERIAELEAGLAKMRNDERLANPWFRWYEAEKEFRERAEAELAEAKSLLETVYTMSRYGRISLRLRADLNNYLASPPAKPKESEAKRGAGP